MSIRVDTELLRTFAAVADSGSFTGAAELVGRTQSAVSMQIKKLEEVGGRPLFARHARGVRLTAQGQTLLVRARQILALLGQVEDALGGDPLEGIVRVGVPEEYGSTVLPVMLARFAQSHPSVEVTVRCEPSPTLEAALGAREVDVAVLVVDGGRGQGEVLVRDPTVWVTSARHRVHEQDPVPVALFDPACWWRDRALEMLEQRSRAYRVAYTSRSVAGLQAAVTSGLAIAVLARSTVPAGARILTSEDGYADLPGSEIVLRHRVGASSRAAAGMADAIRGAFRLASS